MKQTIITLLLAIVSLSSYAQKGINVSGTVTDMDGEPLIGATIKVPGSNTGSVSDLDGNFSIKVPDNTKALAVSYVGYKTQTVAVKAGRSLRIKLMEDANDLDQVVVIGYGAVKKGSVTSAISSVKGEDLQDRAASNVASVLQGELAGVEVRNFSGAPGGSVEISVRGATSVNDEMPANPLYVVDGIPMDDDFDLSYLNMDDIESIEVLKDASSSAIYGSRGANGVVIVTLKKGKGGKSDISFHAIFGLQTPEKRIDNLSPTEWIAWRSKYNDQYYVDHYGSKGATAADDFYTRMQYTGLNADSMNDPRWTMPGYGGLALIDWQDEMYRVATFQNYSLSAMGGGTRGNYRLSVSYTNQNGIIIESGFKKLTANLSGEIKLKDYITVGLSVAPTVSWADGSNVDGKDSGIATASWRTTPVAEPDAGIHTGTEPYSSYLWGGSSSPVSRMEEEDNKRENVRLLTSAYINIDFTKHLQAQLLGSWNYTDQKNRNYTPGSIRENWASYPEGYLSTGNWTGTTSHHFLGQALLTYDNTFAKKHDLNVVLGWSAEASSDGYSYSMRATHFPNDNIHGFNFTDEQFTRAEAEYTTDEKMMSVFGRVTYSYDNRYLLNLSLRTDGNSRFGKDRRWATFPAASAAWRVSNEKFWPKNFFMTDAKVRVSYGSNGSRALPLTASRGLMESSNYVDASGAIINGFKPSQLENRDLTWQKTNSWNFGIDLGLWKNRVSMSADYYIKTIKDMLYNLTMPSVVGFEKGYTNTGNIRTKGLDLEIKSNNLTGKLKWTTTLNIGYMTNKVKSLGANSTIYCGRGGSQVIAVGHPVGEYYLYDAIGVYKDQEDLDNSPRETSSRVGGVKYRDVSGPDGTPDGEINEYDRVYMGSPKPKFTYGLTNRFVWKNFDLSFLITAQTGGKIFCGGGRAFDTSGLGVKYNVLQKYTNMWWSENEPGDGVTPGIFVSASEQQASSRWLYSSDFIKLKNITLGYTVPLHKNRFITRLRITAAVENVFMIDDYDAGYSPEANNDGGLIGRSDYGSYPLPRTFSLGINVGL